MRQTGRKGVFTVMSGFRFEEDMGPMLPYINAVAERAELYEKPPMVRFVFQGVYCVVYPDRCIASPMDGRDQARAFADDLIAFLGSVFERRDEIVPNHTVFKAGAVPQILKLLPRTNCGECGLKTCMAFAAMLAKQQVAPGQCPHMVRPLTQTYPVMDRDGRQVSQVTLHLDGKRPRAGKKREAGKDKERTVETPRADAGALTGHLLPDALSPRELQVLGLMGEGLTNPEISKHLHISPHTVKSHVINIFNKLGVNHRTQAVVWAARHGII